MKGLPRRSAAALAPVRGSLRTDARRQVEDIGGDTGEKALALVEEARREAGRMLLAAVQDGEATARLQVAIRSARVRRQAHERVLTRRNALWLELRRQVRESSVELRADPRYPALLARLTELARARLGPDARVDESPLGGVVAEAGSRRLDLSLPVLGTRTLESMTQEVRELWTG